ncbi:MAG: hypothetical protein KA717_39640 [Woronichinia naegeliana WA131]|jgi:hypothetical protein|uniref:Uncharacterized protein n=1 Tax=Woronichinia naegeliana WA131 TaxID=2824559 RepID=A0A977KWW4_9CYAN|nr:MAG: hypothetical protein KA717_39640 [Woronichinia naegeliana WA131]
MPLITIQIDTDKITNESNDDEESEAEKVCVIIGQLTLLLNDFVDFDYRNNRKLVDSYSAVFGTYTYTENETD